jgi:predicted nucleic acid-binding protein
MHLPFVKPVASIDLANDALLVDTSAWIEIFRRPPAITLEHLGGDLDRAVTCLPIIQEVLQGFRDEPAFRAARAAMYSLPCVESPLSVSVVEEAVDIYRRARRAGVTVRSSVDCLIAACAIRYQLTVVHADRDYPAIATIAPLRERNIRQSRGR